MQEETHPSVSLRSGSTPRSLRSRGRPPCSGDTPGDTCWVQRRAPGEYLVIQGRPDTWIFDSWRHYTPCVDSPRPRPVASGGLAPGQPLGSSLGVGGFAGVE